MNNVAVVTAAVKNAATKQKKPFFSLNNANESKKEKAAAKKAAEKEVYRAKANEMMEQAVERVAAERKAEAEAEAVAAAKERQGKVVEDWQGAVAASAVYNEAVESGRINDPNPLPTLRYNPKIHRQNLNPDTMTPIQTPETNPNQAAMKETGASNPFRDTFMGYI